MLQLSAVRRSSSCYAVLGEIFVCGTILSVSFCVYFDRKIDFNVKKCKIM